MAQSQEKKRSSETILEEKQTWDLPDRDFKSAVLNMFKEIKETRRMMSHQIESINKEKEIIKRN